MPSIKAKLANMASHNPSASSTSVEDGPGSESDASTAAGSQSKISSDKYRLLVTAGPSYDTSTHKVVHVNSNEATYVENEFLRAKIRIRIRGFRGLPATSPAGSPYFEDPMHVKDQYSVAFSFVPKRDLPSKDTIWGNDFDHPVRDRLPPGFNYAFKIVKEFIDPGLECDAYADEPWLYGPSLSCWFAFRIGEKVTGDANVSKALRVQDQDNFVLHEGADGSGVGIRESHNLPSNNEKRRKFFLSADNRSKFIFEKDRVYHADFYNPYLDFGKFALKLPGFSINVVKYIDEKSHCLRYVFKNRSTGNVYFCVCMNLLWGEELTRAVQGDEKQVVAFAGAEETDVD